MLDIPRLKNIPLSRRPITQKIVGYLGLWPNFRFPPKVEITLENFDRVPDEAVIFAMNHTDRYNYWPMQFEFARQGLGFTATWVKGKYYESRVMGWFMDQTNNIPVPSRGYVIATEFRAAVGRVPTQAEYRIMRDTVDRKRGLDDPFPESGSTAVREFLARPDFLEWFDRLFNQMMGEVVRLNRWAFEELNIHLLIFPQGTRSRRLTRGHIGMVQMAQHLGATIVPVGCNGSDGLYPGNSPLSKGGRVVYRFGEALTVDGPEFGPYRVPSEVIPFTDDASNRFGARYQAMTDVVMSRVNDLLDPEYRAVEEVDGQGSEIGVNRFVG